MLIGFLQGCSSPALRGCVRVRLRRAAVLQRMSFCEVEDAKHEPELGPFPPHPPQIRVRLRGEGTGFKGTCYLHHWGMSETNNGTCAIRGIGHACERRRLTHTCRPGEASGKISCQEKPVRNIATGRAGPPGMPITGWVYVQEMIVEHV